MASLPTRTTASFAAIAPVPNLTVLDNEFNQYVGASGIFNGGTTAIKLLLKSSDAADPPIEIDQIGAGPLAEWKQNGSLKASIDNDGDLTANGITGAAGVYTFGSIPVGPASNPTADNQLARKAYVDAKTVSFSVGWSIVDPSTCNLNSREFGSFIVPAGGTYTFTKAKIMYRTGSHTAGGSLVFIIERLGFGNISSSGLNDTNDTVDTVYPDNFGDFTAGEDAIFTCYLSSRSGTISERNVMVTLEGFRTVF